MRILDGHVHLLGEAARDYLGAILRAMDRNSVAKAVVFGFQGDPKCPDVLASSAYEQHPDRFVPFTCELDPEAPDLGETVDLRLSKGPWRGVGEVFLAADGPAASYSTRDGTQKRFRYPVPSDGPLSPRWGDVFAACATHAAPVLIHYDMTGMDDEDVLGTLLTRHPRTTFIWAHADWDAVVAERLLGAHSNLIVEVGAHLHFAALDKSEYVADWLDFWVPLLERFTGRITFGSDHFEWRHVEPEDNADAAYEGIGQACDRLTPRAAAAWLSGALDDALATA